MGKMAKEIAWTVGGTIEMLKNAYGAELSTFHYFWYIAQNIEGLGVLEQKFFEERASEELGHSKKVAFRLMQLEVTDNPSEWEQDSGLGKLQPSRYLKLRSAFEKVLEFERTIIKLYNDLTNSKKEKDKICLAMSLRMSRI
ncbi:MAG: ferritin-like domain-containing protein [Candidatus Nitrosopolaris sp.]